MRMLERRHPPGPRPCSGAEILEQVLRDERSAHLSVTDEVASDEPAAGEKARLTPEDWFMSHGVAFLVGGWNLVLIDYAHTRDRWWCWLPLAIWLSVLALHGGWVFLARQRADRSPDTGGSSHEVPHIPPGREGAERHTKAVPQQPFCILVARGGKLGEFSGSGMTDGALD